MPLDPLTPDSAPSMTPTPQNGEAASLPVGLMRGKELYASSSYEEGKADKQTSLLDFMEKQPVAPRLPKM